MEKYTYSARALSVHDGDTLIARVDLGFHTSVELSFRLARIDAPEVTGTTRHAGLAARDYLVDIVMGAPLMIKTVKDRKEKYGRYLAEVYVASGADIWSCVNDELVTQGLAVYRDY